MPAIVNGRTEVPSSKDTYEIEFLDRTDGGPPVIKGGQKPWTDPEAARKAARKVLDAGGATHALLIRVKRLTTMENVLK